MAGRTEILKQGAPLAARVVPAAVHDANRRGRELVEAAEAEASRLLARAEAECARIRADAAEEGLRVGRAQAAGVLVAAAAERDRLLASAERELLSLALAIARKVLGTELVARPDAVADLAARALHEARERREVTIRIHPADAGAVRAAGERLGAILRRASLAVREDPELARGAVVVETEAGRIDAAVEAQLEALASALEEPRA